MKTQRAGNRSETAESPREERARNAQGNGKDASVFTAVRKSPARWVHLLERAVERSNMQQAYRRIVSNRGASGVDGLTVRELGRNGKGH